jgi:hypothetical protein
MEQTKGIAIIEAAGGKLCPNGKTFHVGKNKYVKYPNKNGVFGLWFGGSIIGHAETEDQLRAFLATDYKAELSATTTPPVKKAKHATGEVSPVTPPVVDLKDTIASPKISPKFIRMSDGTNLSATSPKVGTYGPGTPTTPRQLNYAKGLGILVADGEFDRIGLSNAIRVALTCGYVWEKKAPAPVEKAPIAPQTLTVDARLDRIESVLNRLLKQ